MKTSAEYITGFDFTYFRTYSFQRTEAHKELDQLMELRKNGALAKEDRTRYDVLNDQLLGNRYKETILDEDQRLNPTATMIREVRRTDEQCATLLQHLKTEIEEELLWLCSPIYRDAILFYNAQDELVEGINICLECDRIETIRKEHITTDFKTFKYLKQFLLQLGHDIENPGQFKADHILETISKNKEKT